MARIILYVRYMTVIYIYMLYNMILCRRMYSTLKVSQSEVAKHFFGGCPEVKTYSSNDCYNGWWFEHVFYVPFHIWE